MPSFDTKAIAYSVVIGCIGASMMAAYMDQWERGVLYCFWASLVLSLHGASK